MGKTVIQEKKKGNWLRHPIKFNKINHVFVYILKCFAELGFEYTGSVSLFTGVL